MAAAKKSSSNALGDQSQSLQTFNLLDLQQYTQEKSYSTTASKDFHLFYVGRDDVHDILKHVLSRVTVSLYLNMFGFDDDELNDILMAKAMDPRVTMLITLDKSQAGGKHEKALLDSDAAKDPTVFSTHFVVGQSATHQISHTKGFVADGKVGGEGSTNWSASGEGTFVVARKAGRPGLQSAEQYADDFHRPRHRKPVSGGIDRGTYGRASAEGSSEEVEAAVHTGPTAIRRRSHSVAPPALPHHPRQSKELK